MDDEVYSLSEEDIKLRYITPAIMEKGLVCEGYHDGD